MLCGDVIWPIIQRIMEMDPSGFMSLSTTTTDLTESDPSAQPPCSPPNTATASFALKEPFVPFQPSGATLLPPAPSGPRPGCSLRRPSPWQLPSIQHPQIMKTIDIGECRPLEYCCSKLDMAVAQVHSDKVTFWRIPETLRGKIKRAKKPHDASGGEFDQMMPSKKQEEEEQNCGFILLAVVCSSTS